MSKYSEFEKGYVEDAIKMTLDRMEKLGVEKFRIKELISMCKIYDIDIEDL